MRRSLVPASSAYALLRRMPTTFPSSAPSGHPLSPARSRAMEEPPLAYGPTEALVPTTLREEHRLPEDRDAFHRHDTRRMNLREGIAPSGLRAGSLAHAAHTFSPEGSVFLKGPCKGHGAVTRGSVTTTRVQTPFLPVGTAVPGTDDPSTPTGSTSSAVDED
jgi:hypothetical protein